MKKDCEKKNKFTVITVFICSRYKAFPVTGMIIGSFISACPGKVVTKKRKEEVSRSIANQQERNVLIDNCHNYATRPMDNIMLSNAEDDEFPSLPVTPCKPPPSKKPNMNSDIVATLSLLINSRCDAIEKMVGANTMVIEGLKKTGVCMW